MAMSNYMTKSHNPNEVVGFLLPFVNIEDIPNIRRLNKDHRDRIDNYLLPHRRTLTVRFTNHEAAVLLESLKLVKRFVVETMFDAVTLCNSIAHKLTDYPLFIIVNQPWSIECPSSKADPCSQYVSWRMNYILKNLPVYLIFGKVMYSDDTWLYNLRAYSNCIFNPKSISVQKETKQVKSVCFKDGLYYINLAQQTTYLNYQQDGIEYSDSSVMELVGPSFYVLQKLSESKVKPYNVQLLYTCEAGSQEMIKLSKIKEHISDETRQIGLGIESAHFKWHRITVDCEPLVHIIHLYITSNRQLRIDLLNLIDCFPNLQYYKTSQHILPIEKSLFEGECGLKNKAKFLMWVKGLKYVTFNGCNILSMYLSLDASLRLNLESFEVSFKYLYEDMYPWISKITSEKLCVNTSDYLESNIANYQWLVQSMGMCNVLLLEMCDKGNLKAGSDSSSVKEKLEKIRKCGKLPHTIYMTFMVSKNDFDESLEELALENDNSLIEYFNSLETHQNYLGENITVYILSLIGGMGYKIEGSQTTKSNQRTLILKRRDIVVHPYKAIVEFEYEQIEYNKVEDMPQHTVKNNKRHKKAPNSNPFIISAISKRRKLRK